MITTLLEKIDDLILQATRERSHFYVASVLVEARQALALQDVAVAAAVAEARDYALREAEILLRARSTCDWPAYFAAADEIAAMREEKKDG